MKGKISPKLWKLLCTSEGRDLLYNCIIEGKHRMARNDNSPWKKQGLTEAQYFKKKYLEELERNNKYKLALEEIATYPEEGINITNIFSEENMRTANIKYIAQEALK